ncbi:MAG: HAD family phosphatase [Candidatus Cloacimonetes bacterium]|nr:HAD family phosphatase [Candidatus Cloacimonadota bacterium]
MDIKAVIFDLDGTLIDSMGIWRNVDIEYLQKRGIEVTPDLFTNLPQGNSFSELAHYVKDKFNLPDSIETICNEWTQMVKGHYENQLKLRPGVMELLRFLKKKHILMAVGTSNSLELTQSALKNNKVSDYFRVVISGDTHLRGKPFPDIFIEAAKNLDLSADECLVIEDTLVGVLSAKAAGMRVIAIKEPDSQSDWFRIKQEADFAVSHFEEILLYLQGSLR